MSFIEVSLRSSPSDLAKLLNEHLELKMFLVGHSITAADLVALSHILAYFVIYSLSSNFFLNSKAFQTLRSFLFLILSVGLITFNIYQDFWR